MTASEHPLAQAENALFALKSLSARLGADVTRTQGAGGNTSLKIDGVMWVKASGTWLRDARENNIFVPVALDPLRAALDQGDTRADKATDFVRDDLNHARLRPSIETSVHAILPQAAIAHYHCVNTIAHSVRADAEQVLAGHMKAVPDLSWAMVPYRRPGLPLALAIAETLESRPDVLFLRNHGIVVMADGIETLESRIEAVSAALAITPRDTGRPDLATLHAMAEGTGYTLPNDRSTHLFALDPASLEAALMGSLYPDHVIFLGTEIGIAEPGAPLPDGAQAPKLVVVPDKGVLVASSLTPGGQAMVQCLSAVALRLATDCAIETLSAADEHELTHWEAEQYRQSLDRAKS